MNRTEEKEKKKELKSSVCLLGDTQLSRLARSV